ncbi:MAG: hypothetical protein ACOX7K_08850 [Oscillospiraceae bacterium]|jgi:hypothetical protein
MSDIGSFTYEEVFFRMTPQQINEANIALDIVEEANKKAAKRRR